MAKSEPTGDPAVDAKQIVDNLRESNARYYAAHPEATPIPEHEYAKAEAEIRGKLEKLKALSAPRPAAKSRRPRLSAGGAAPEAAVVAPGAEAPVTEL